MKKLCNFNALLNYPEVNHSKRWSKHQRSIYLLTWHNVSRANNLDLTA